MISRSAGVPAPRRAPLAVFALALVLIVSLPGVGLTARPASTNAAGHPDSTPPLSIVSFSFQPSSVDVGSSTTVSVTLSGGDSPYFLWFNSSVPGCEPPNSPVSSSSTQFQFSCQPTQSGSYSIHLDVADSSTPSLHQSTVSDLNVVSNSNGNNNSNNNNNGNGNGSGSGGGLTLPSGLESLVLVIGLVFLGTMIAIAAGTIATAALVSRRLRQINETLAKLSLPPKEPKPPA
jgi:hypothetical protein